MEIVKKISLFVLPCVVILLAFIILFGKKNYFASFLRGAKSGITSSFNVLPTMCALIVSISMFLSSGVEPVITEALLPVLGFLGIPAEIFPLILLRPFSGSASLATFEGILEKYGADSLAGLSASIIMASSDTVIYVICIYFSTVKIRKTRHALPISLLVTAFCILLSVFVSRVFLNMFFTFLIYFLFMLGI